ncbi:MAG: hypothetical protein Kow0099_10360 [Candidatus Abyssubacteria bacterium]
MQAARLFGALSEPARLRILQLLREGAMCGRELAVRLDLTPATTCHHLERLKLANLLSERRSGKFVYYSISDSELASAVKESLTAIGSEIELPEEKPVRRRKRRSRRSREPNQRRKDRA